MRTKRGFTLIEMLTVIVIISILAGITMKLMVYVNQKTGKARAASDIERIKHALIEYQSVYGIFPPSNVTSWEFKGIDPPATPDKGIGYHDGLAKYLFNDPQTNRWCHYLEGWGDPSLEYREGHKDDYGKLVWSNNFCTIRDPWNQEYIYASQDPYVAFKLYSVGPDGKPNTADDVGDKWNE